MRRRARGRRLSGQGPGWLTVSHRDATRSQRPGLTATHLGLSGRPPWLSSSKDIGVLQISRGQQGFLSSDSSSVGLWGRQAGGNCSPGILRFPCHSGGGLWLDGASGGSHCLSALQDDTTLCYWLGAKSPCKSGQRGACSS